MRERFMVSQEAYMKVHYEILARREDEAVKSFLILSSSTHEVKEASWNPGEKTLSKALDALGIPISSLHEKDITPIRVFPELGVISAVSKVKSILDLIEQALAKLIRRVEPVPRSKALLISSVPMIKTPFVWEQGYTGKGVKVAVVDSGIDPSHPELPRAVASRSFVEDEPVDDLDGHGTHVAGIIAGRGEIYSGIAPDASLINSKVLNKDGWGYDDDIFAGIEWAVEVAGAQVVNLSLGHTPLPSEAEIKFASKYLEWIRRGVLFVAAAGNEGPAPETIKSPAIIPGVIAVGAVDKQGLIASFSSRGSQRVEKILGEIKPTLVAPGVSIVSTFPSDISHKGKIDPLHAYLSGTSMAAPHVTGIIALLLEASAERGYPPQDNYSNIVASLIASARSLQADKYAQGHGIIDSRRALAGLGKQKIQAPGEDALDRYRNYLSILESENLNARVESMVEILQSFLGVGILAMSFLSPGGNPSASILDALRKAYQSGLITREQYIYTLAYLLDKQKKQ
ncbi:MAG: S8 family peptidase [Infirmifilum sp.]